MSRIVKWLDRALYPGVERNWDDDYFRELILEKIGRDCILLDLGAGAGIVTQMNFKGVAKKVCGVDVDARVLQNPFLDEGRVADAGSIPYPDESFDLVIADNVMEHVSDPAKVFVEVSRVLKPGGHFMFKTPNRWHYMPIIARMTPHNFHQWLNEMRGRDAVDTFPTLYLANSRGQVNRLSFETGFAQVSLKLVEGRPEYLRIFAPFYLVGFLYERIVNSSLWFQDLRVVMIATLAKPVC